MKRTLMVLLIAALAVPVFADEVYKAKCAMCHGLDGKGQTPAGKAMNVQDLSSADVQKMSDKDLAATITDGKGKMPAFKGKLTPAEITSLVSYIRTLKK